MVRDKHGEVEEGDVAALIWKPADAGASLKILTESEWTPLMSRHFILHFPAGSGSRRGGKK